MPELARLIGTDSAVLSQTSLVTRESAGLIWPDSALPFAVAEPIAQMWSQHPMIAMAPAAPATPPSGSVRLSEFISRREWHAHPVYQDCYRDVSADDQMFAVLGARGHLITQLCLSRSGRPYSDRSSEILDLAIPHLRAALERAWQADSPYTLVRMRAGVRTTIETLTGPPVQHPSPVLTPRETTVMRLVAQGLTSGQLGRRLGISPRTIEKHLEHVHAKLGVTNRVAAIAAFRESVATVGEAVGR